MSSARAWLRTELTRSTGRTLDTAMLAGDGLRYAASRIGMVATRACARTVLHSVELWLLSREMPFEFLVPLFTMRALPGLLGGIHWGALEALRSAVRHDVHGDRPTRARATCEAWLSAAALLGTLMATAVIVWVARQERGEDGPYGLYGLFAIVSAVAFGLELWSRTYHAGVFALGRVYRPVWSMLLPDTLELASIVALWPRLGPFAVHAGVLLTALVRTALTFFYARRAYLSRHLEPPHLLRLRSLRRLSLSDLKTGTVHALSSAPLQLDRALLLALLNARAPDELTLALSAPYYALRPIVGLAQSWARPFFTDFVRLDVPGFGVLRARFERELRRAGYVTAALSSLLTACAAMLLFGRAGLFAAAWLAPLAFVRASFALDQVRAFAYAAHLRQLAVGLVLALGLACLSLLHATDRSLLLAVVGLLLVVQIAQRGLTSRAAERRALEARRLPISAWIASLHRETRPVRVSVARVDTRTVRAAALLETLASARPNMRMARLGRAWLLWWEPLSDAASRLELSQACGGTLAHLAQAEGAHGDAALSAARSADLLPPELSAALARSTSALRSRELRADFARLVPAGIVIDLLEPTPALRLRPAQELSLIRRALIAAAREQHHVPPWAPWQVAVYAPGGETQLAFVWPAGTADTGQFRRRVLYATWCDSAL